MSITDKAVQLLGWQENRDIAEDDAIQDDTSDEETQMAMLQAVISRKREERKRKRESAERSETSTPSTTAAPSSGQHPVRPALTRRPAFEVVDGAEAAMAVAKAKSAPPVRQPIPAAAKAAAWTPPVEDRGGRVAKAPAAAPTVVQAPPPAVTKAAAPAMVSEEVRLKQAFDYVQNQPIRAALLMHGSGKGGLTPVCRQAVDASLTPQTRERLQKISGWWGQAMRTAVLLDPAMARNPEVKIREWLDFHDAITHMTQFIRDEQRLVGGTAQ